MLRNFKKFALGNEQLKAIKGGEISCNLTVDDPNGAFVISGSCGSNVLSECTDWAGGLASQLAIQSGYQVHYTCMAP